MTLIEKVEQALTAYAEKLDLTKSVLRYANKPTVSILEGADGITRQVTSPPKGMFLVVPDNAVDSITKAIAEKKALNNSDYLKLRIGNRTFEIGACSHNKLKNQFEIWFDTKLGSTAQPVANSWEEIGTQLDERMQSALKQGNIVVVKDEMKSAVPQPVKEAVPAGIDENSALPF